MKHITDEKEKLYGWDNWPEEFRLLLSDEFGADFILDLFLNKFDKIEIHDRNDLHYDIAHYSYYAGLRTGYSFAYNLIKPFQKFKKEAEEATGDELGYFGPTPRKVQ